MARLRKIREMIGAMCADGRPPRMSIPARPNEDEDIVISDAADDAADLIEQQAARIKELEKDAERYRWLRGHSFGIYTGPDTRIHYGAGFNQTKPESLDAAIDAAMEADK